MVDEREIETLLRDMAADTEPLGDDLRASLLAAAPRPTPTPPWWRRIGLSAWGGALGVPLAALCGVWLGIAQPALVLQVVPGAETMTTVTEGDALFDDIYGSSWEEWL